MLREARRHEQRSELQDDEPAWPGRDGPMPGDRPASPPEPVVDAVRVAAAGAHQIDEEHAVDELGALPEHLVAHEDALHEHEREHTGEARTESDHEAQRAALERREVDPERGRRVPVVEQ